MVNNWSLNDLGINGWEIDGVLECIRQFRQDDNLWSLFGSDETTRWRRWSGESHLFAGSSHLRLEAFRSWWIIGDCLTLGSKHLEVFQSVGVSWTTGSLKVVNQVSVAIKVFWDIGHFFLLDCLKEFRSSIFEKIVDLESLLKFVFKWLLVYCGWIRENFGVKMVECDVSCVDSEVILSLGLTWGVSFPSIGSISTEFCESRPDTLWNSVVSCFKFSNNLLSNWCLAPLENMRSVSFFLDSLELHLKSFDSHFRIVCILHPVDGEKIS